MNIGVGSQQACRLLQIRFIFALATSRDYNDLQIENCPLLLHRLQCLCIIIVLRLCFIFFCFMSLYFIASS